MIYLDHAATTPCRPEVVRAMLPHLSDSFGNASSIHRAGQQARQALDKARAQVAAAIGARTEEICFTASGTEANNLALTGAFLAARGHKKHLISTPTEHHAVLNTLDHLREQGAEVTLLGVDSNGCVDPDELRRAIRPDTLLVSVMWANNEIGTVAPLDEIAKVTRECQVPLHTDAVQAMGALPVNVNEPKVDLLSLSGHKFYGPKGAGVLFVRKGTALKPIVHGGSQERRRRAGTENVPAIAGLGVAAELSAADRPREHDRLSHLRDRMIGRILAEIPGAVLNGHPTMRLPNNVNVSFPGLEAETLLINLDLSGIAASSGSACTAGSLEPSHVLAALNLPHERTMGAIRFSLGRSTTARDVDNAVRSLAQIVQRLRS